MNCGEGHYEYELLDDATGDLMNDLSSDGWELQYCTPVGLGTPKGVDGVRVIFAAMFRRWIETPAATELTVEDTQELPAIIEEAPNDATPTPLENLAEAAEALDDEAPESDETPAAEPPIRTVTGTVVEVETGETPARLTVQAQTQEIINESNRKCAEAMRKTFDDLQGLRAEQDAYRADHAPLFARIETKVGA